jgi:hypothetical protein
VVQLTLIHLALIHSAMPHDAMIHAHVAHGQKGGGAQLGDRRRHALARRQCGAGVAQALNAFRHHA